MTQPSSAAQDAELVTMLVGEAHFGVPVMRVRDVLSTPIIYPVPLAPREILGSINLRGRIVTAIDLRVRLGLPARAAGAPCKCVIVERAGGEQYALLVDEIGDVMSLTANAYEPNPITLAKAWTSLCRGLYRRAHDMLIVLDIDELLSLDQAKAA